ncbi:hypothetical protein FGO68_gene4586 [Halteria grandinella]|uniref:Uncharacterized protein n=1 Tax=Halteria grandinella TaxID=5974 RepID=A0A8J8NCM3_HALGN|nr:hypothetical protein FGO68_gene4586 [Halteria grandinella]
MPGTQHKLLNVIQNWQKKRDARLKKDGNKYNCIKYIVQRRASVQFEQNIFKIFKLFHLKREKYPHLVSGAIKLGQNLNIAAIQWLQLESKQSLIP